jgi:hypothetical protein
VNRRLRSLLLFLVAAGVLVTLWWWVSGGNETPTAGPLRRATDEQLWAAVPAGLTPPADVSNDTWDTALGGDTAGELSLVGLNGAVIGEVPDSGAALDLAGRFSVARLTGAGGFAALDDSPFASREPDSLIADRCTDVEPFAVSVMALPEDGSTRYAKAVVLYRGACPDQLERQAVRVTYVYLANTGSGWVPVRETQVPWSANEVIGGGATTPPEDSLATLQGCVADTVQEPLQLLSEAAASWEVMCDDAARDGVELRAVSALRDPSEQAERSVAAGELFNDPLTAQRWVASSDRNGCASRHCAGAAVDVDGAAGQRWVSTITGCLGGQTLSEPVDKKCPSGSSPVTRASSYGFVLPLKAQPWHLEFVWPTSAPQQTTCAPPLSASVPEMIGSIWRCRIGAAGFSAERARVIAAEAVLVGKCTSGWNPGALEAGGRWRTEVDPATGIRRDGAGVFLLDSVDAQQFVPGGVDFVRDARANISGAAALWISGNQNGDGWVPWPCAKQTAPSAGGPALTDTAFLW